MALKDRIRDLRQARGWTQTELAERSGLKQGTITNLETGARDNPTRDTLAKLAGAFGITVQELLGNDILDGPFPAANLRDLGLTDAFLARYARLWVDLPRDQRAWLIGHLRIVADAERRIRALEAAAADDEPDRVVPADAQGPAVLAHIVS
jgi:transcriptional regulator with XRE-family HTH domain